MKKNFTAIRIRRQLEQSVGEAGFNIPLKISAEFWASMRLNIRKEIRQETRVEFLEKGIVGRWGGRPLFVIAGAANEPKPYPKGAEILQSIAAAKKGEKMADDAEKREIDRFLQDFDGGELEVE